MTYATIDELKNSLTNVLQSHNLNQSLIDTLLSDEFINGAYNLIQNEPENDEFMAFVRNFSTEQNLYSMKNAQDKILEEIGKDGYFSSIFQYVIDAWRDIDFSISILLSSVSSYNDEESNNQKPETILDVVLNITGFIPGLQAYAKELGIYKDIAVAVHEQDKKFYEIADRFDQELRNVANGIRNNIETAETSRSPLVLDLDGDGVETTGVENGTHFDHDSNDFAEKSGWVGKDDGLLVHDKNNNGTIDDGTELFGNNSVLSSGTTAKNGFEALADLDSNNDGIFNSSDTEWNNIKVWKDANGNGIVDEGELLSLVQAGIYLL